MGRKNRSSSIGNLKDTTRPRSSSLSSTPAPGAQSKQPNIDTDACNTIFNRFLHEKDFIGRTFLHNAVHTVSSDVKPGQKLDGYFLMDAIFKRAKELDMVAKDKSKGSVSHLHKLMLAKDEENGYTPLHYAILQRDLASLLLLLKHASTVPDDDEATHSQQMQHPLRLMDCHIEDEGISRVMRDLAVSMDNESLSPLQLLGATSASELEKCRETTHWSFLKQVWKKQVQSETNTDGDQDTNPRRYRQRMISFGDERDYLNNDVDHAPNDHADGRRSRSGSFHVQGLDHDEDDDDEGELAGSNHDLLPLGDVDFTLLVDPDSVKARREEDVLSVDSGSVDYGCEVYTFGKSDHCALGVPQFGTAGRRDKKSMHDKHDLSAASHKPRRVEAFALGDMRRGWSNPKASALSEKDTVDSPVVAVAAAAHHTLALTRGGRLFAFGLGKGGRLGTGDENHRPLPARILGPLTNRIVSSIAAAENHSLCATAFDGGCYAWGSNGFGQLGMPSDQDQGSRLMPRRVEDLKSSFVVAVSAGSRHSVALTRSGEVFCWGDNKAGQLGSSSLLSVGSSPASPSQSNHRCCHRPQRVEGLWLANPQRKAIAISASEFSTLVLARPPTNGEASLASLPVNVVYSWGHGSPVPLRVNFPDRNASPAQNDSSTFSRSTCVNPTSIASAKYHNVAITADGRVFTWGINSDSLGIEKAEKTKGVDAEGNWATPKGKGNIHNSVISSPQLVFGMLPENGGGRAVAVSASESHSAVVTADGHLFTWGSSYGNDALGHKGVKFQPGPRKVTRVHRAVGVAASNEHTALLIGTSFPCLPRSAPPSGTSLHNPLSLLDSAAVEMCRNVDVSNVIPVALIAQRVNSKPLLKFCEKFIEMNLDGVLSAGSIADLESLLMGVLPYDSTVDRHGFSDGTFHPLLYNMANSKDWMQNSHNTLKSLKGCFEAKQSRKVKKIVSSKAKATEKLQRDEPTDSKRDKLDHPSSLQALQNVEKAASTQNIQKSDLGQHVPKTKPSGNSSKYYCEVCSVSCPDSASYTLHMSGRRHFNRANHVRQEEEKAMAEKMMAVKRMQLMGGESNQKSVTLNSPVPKAPIEKSHAANGAWISPQPTKKPVVTVSAVNTKLRSNSLLGIMNEEMQKSTNSRVQVTPQPSARSKTATPLSSGKKLSFSPQPTLSAISNPSTLKTFSLSAFIAQDVTHQKRNEVKAVGAIWATSKPDVKHGPTSFSYNKTKSFAEIQKEEQDRVKREDHMCHIGGNKWFVQQRDRAASIGDIQQQEKDNAEWLQLVEEQKMIEAQIVRECKIKAKQEKAKKHRNRQRKKPANSSGTPKPVKTKVSPQECK